MKLAALLLTIAIVSLAQVAPSTTLSGTVVDQSGASVPNAAADLTNTNTQSTRHVKTDEQGRFLFDLVPPGQYELTVTASGFSIHNRHGITLDANVPASLRITLTVSGLAEQVTVQENAPMVDTESGALHQVVSQKYIEALPLNGRNAATLVYMAPGTVQGKGTDVGGYATTSDTIAVS